MSAVRRTDWSVRAFCEVVEPADVAIGYPRDAEDIPVPGTLIASGADVRVTGDRDLLALRAQHPIETPAEFVQRIWRRVRTATMARIVLSDWRTLEVTGAAQREIETLAVLAGGLPDESSVFPGAHWTGLDKGYVVFGEIDFVSVLVANSAQTVLSGRHCSNQ